MNFKHILVKYSEASGQMINLDKSSINFSTNVRDEDRISVGEILRVANTGLSGNYLGLPSLVGRNKT